MKSKTTQRPRRSTGDLEVERADAAALEPWDERVEQSPHGYPFHRLDALRVQASHAGADLHPLVGREGGEPVGLFPVFEITRGGVSTVFSPPPDLWVPRLGPVLLDAGVPDRQRAEKRNWKFVRGCLDWIDETLSPKYSHVRTPTGYPDVRPFRWRDFGVVPRYTYVVDLSPGEAVRESFSRDARKNVRSADPDRYEVREVREASASAIERIIRQVSRRHEEQGVPYTVEPPFVADLYQRLPEGTVRAYVCTVDGEFATGMVTLEDRDTIYRWQGGVKGDTDLPTTDLLDWHIMRDAIDRGVRYYDLVGANDPRISRYKAKFSPDLEPYYSLERSTRVMGLLSEVYKRLR